MYNKPERRCINMQRNIKTLLEKHPVSETILNIPVDYLEGHVVRYLFLTLKYADLHTFKDIIELPFSDFADFPNVGFMKLHYFYELKRDIIADRDELGMDFEKIIRIEKLLKKPITTTDQSFLEMFKNVANEYFSLHKSRFKHQFIFPYYGIDSVKYTFQKIGEENDITRERARQIIRNYTTRLHALLTNETRLRATEWITPEASKLMRTTILKLRSIPIHTYESIKEYFSGELHESFDAEKEKVLTLFLDVIGIRQCDYTVREKFNVKLFFTEKETQTEFLKTAFLVKKIILNEPYRLTLEELTAQVEKTEPDTKPDYIKMALQIFPQIESIEISNQLYYQKKIDKYTSVNDLVYKILKQNNRAMHIDEIIKELNTSYHNIKHHNYTRNNIKLQRPNKLKSIGKTRYWSLSEWDITTDTISESLRKIMRRHNKPTTGKEIISEMELLHPDLKRSSLLTIININCLTVFDPSNYASFERKTYILPEWQSRYPDLPIKPKRNIPPKKESEIRIKIRTKIIELLKTSPTGKMKAVEIIKEIRNEFPISNNQFIYKLFSDERYFKKTFDEKIHFSVGLKQN